MFTSTWFAAEGTLIVPFAVSQVRQRVWGIDSGRGEEGARETDNQTETGRQTDRQAG